MPADTMSSVARARTALLAVAGDAVVVLAFSATGRGFHNEENPVVGVLTTAWPFLAGLAVVWALPIVRRRPLRVWPTGVVVWLGTYLVGMVLRGVTGAGLAAPFLVVALCVLGAALLGWRAVAVLVRRSTRR